MFYFMGKIKPENKQKIKLNILTTGRNKQQFSNLPKDIHTVTTCFPDDNNYMQKIEFATKQKETYSIKLDEDIFFSNYVWDFIIENIDKLDDAMFMSPILSTGVSFIDDYMDALFTNEEREAVAGFADKYGIRNQDGAPDLVKAHGLMSEMGKATVKDDTARARFAPSGSSSHTETPNNGFNPAWGSVDDIINAALS